MLPLHTCFLFKPDFPTLAPPPLTHNLFSLPLFSAFNLSIWRVRTLFSLSLPLSPLCVCVCVCVCVCGCLTDSHLCAPTLSPSRSLSLSPSVVFSLKLTHTLYRSISYCLSLAHAHSLSPSLPLSLTRSISRSLSRTPFPVRSVLGNNDTLTEMYACMYVCMYACMHVCVYVCMYACMCVCMYHTYVCVYVYIHTHTHAHTHTHTHTHTSSPCQHALTACVGLGFLFCRGEKSSSPRTWPSWPCSTSKQASCRFHYSPAGGPSRPHRSLEYPIPKPLCSPASVASADQSPAFIKPPPNSPS